MYLCISVSISAVQVGIGDKTQFRKATSDTDMSEYAD